MVRYRNVGTGGEGGRPEKGELEGRINSRVPLVFLFGLLELHFESFDLPLWFLHCLDATERNIINFSVVEP
jgi:hypothetical protein